MTTEPIVESGMTFGPFDAGRCFHIEKSRTYQRVQQGVKMAEFLLLQDKDGTPPIVWIVEARSSTPRYEKDQQKFDDFINEIREKLVNALSLGLAACLKRHRDADTELPNSFKTLELSTADFRLVLVINGHKDEWLPPLQDELKKALSSTIKTWALQATAVAVINEQKARSYGLILANTQASQ